MTTPYRLQIKAKIMQVREATGPTVRGCESVAGIFEDAARADREMVFVLTLSQKHRVIDRHIVSMGTLTSSLVHPREVFRPAILDSAAAVVMVHNHPSGDCTPSKEDHEITSRIKKAGDMLGIRVLDHVIVAGKEHFSFCESGAL